MGMPVTIVADRRLDEDLFVGAVSFAWQLSDAYGIGYDPQLSIQRISEGDLRHNRLGQVDCTVIDDLPRFANKGITAVVVAKDLGVPDNYRRPLNFLYGVSNFRSGNFIMSTHRLKLPEDAGAIALHEAGHSLGLVPETAPNYDRLSSFPGHCQNVCIMRPGSGYSDDEKMVKHIDSHDPFCVDCIALLRGMRHA